MLCSSTQELTSNELNRDTFVCLPNCLKLGGACGFGLMPKSTDADKEAHSWRDAGLFTEWTQTMARGLNRL